MEKSMKINVDGFNCGAQMTCPRCGNNDMNGHGGSFGGRITIYKRKCPECGCTLMIVPLKEEYRYSVTAVNEDEEKSRWDKRQKLRKLEEEADSLRRELRID